MRRDSALPWVSVACAATAFAACLVGWRLGDVAFDIAWAPTLDLRIDFALDGLGALYALLATGIGVAVFMYGSAYLPRHLAKARRPQREASRFWPWMVLFMVAMVGLACARDLIVIFVLFDLTAIASYFLIGFDRERVRARGAALMALLITGVGAVAMLVGAVLLYQRHGTFSLDELIERADGGGATTVAGVLIAVACLAKSAQVPLHFWLPRAMEAPTPVSAYLHSAAMVAAGVLVIGRVHPLLQRSELVLDLLLIVGLASIVVGGLLALAQDELKQLLAHSTISQYGYVVTLYGIGGEAAAGAAALYVIAHAIAKSALFMTAGAVTEATGRSRLSQLGGLARPMPVLAAASLVAAATLAALPLTLGYFKDELFFAAAHDEGGFVAVMAVVAAALTFAYIGRFWTRLFLGPRRMRPRPIPAMLYVPVVLLAAVSLAGGVAVGPFAALAQDAAEITHGGPVELHPAYHVNGGAENIMTLAAWGLGLALLLMRQVRRPLTVGLARLGDRIGPRTIYRQSLHLLNVASDRIHAEEVRDLRNSIAAVIMPGGILIGIALATTLTGDSWDIGRVRLADIPVLALMALVVVAGIVAARDRGHVRIVLSLSLVGFGLSAIYALVGAPDVALVAVLIETVASLVFFAVLARLPRRTRTAGLVVRPARPRRRLRNPVIGAVSGLAMFALVWASLSNASAAPGDAQRQIELTPEAHGGDVVTVILADFRGLDTLGEITVLTIAAIGVATLLRRGRLW